ncbi:hypothetical protein GCM10010433_26930 [Streptomyces pulveraceus]
MAALLPPRPQPRPGRPNLPEAAGDVIVQGEDLGRWVTAQGSWWEQFLPILQRLLENTPGIEGAGKEERPVKQTQNAKWAANLAAATQAHRTSGDGGCLESRQDGTDGSVMVKLSTRLDNTRRRTTKLPERHRTDLDALDMR